MTRTGRGDLYSPIRGGWQLARTHLTEPAGGGAQGSPRTHSRPLFPPSEFSLIWNKAEIRKIESSRDYAWAFRPLVLAYNEPRFTLDLHTAGGLCGHLIAGLAQGSGPSKWFHDWNDLEVSYVDGRMEYRLRDAAFPGVTVALEAVALADAVGFLLHYEISGLKGPASLVWAYGGASAYYTGYDFANPMFNFDPRHCAKDTLTCRNGVLTLFRSFDEKERPGLAHVLPSWWAAVQVTAGRRGRTGLADPRHFSSAPNDLLASARWSAPLGALTETNCIGLQEIPLGGERVRGQIVAGMGGNIRDVIRRPAQARRAALKRNRRIAGTFVTRTPDPSLDAASTMQAFATEALWGGVTILHGGWSWRDPYLGWRTWYGPTCLGWTGRVRDAIRNNIRLALVRDPAQCDCVEPEDRGRLRSLLPHYLEYYNMNLVFLDHVRHYFEHTEDVTLMREIFPALAGIADWMNRRLQPENEGLYESALDVCVSDHHFYIRGQTTIASAYMLRAHNLLADVAERLGENPAPFRERARLTRNAMQRKLWMTRPGVFAEYVDTLNHRMLHPEPALPAIFHSAEFGAADELQLVQMLHWVDTHLDSVRPPYGGKLWWASNWSPNYSHYEPNTTDNLNFALTNYLGGRGTEAYAIIQGVMGSMFEGPHPGCLRTGAQNAEFGDTVSMWVRTVIEGLFGIHVRRCDHEVTLSPQFPEEWPEAAIRTPHFAFDWRRNRGGITISWESPVRTRVRLRLPLRAAAIKQVTIDGRKGGFSLQAGVGFSWLLVETPAGRKGEIRVSYEPASPALPLEMTVKQGDSFELNLAQCAADDLLDPQNILKDVCIVDGLLRGVVKGEPGPALLYLSSAGKKCPSWIPLAVRVEPKVPQADRRWVPPDVPARDLSRWKLIDLRAVFNSSPAEASDRVYEAAQPPPLPATKNGFWYWRYHLTGYWPYTAAKGKPGDAAWRGKVGTDGVAWTTDGIPFRTVKEGPNIGIVTLAGGFPAKLEFPVHAAGETLYLMISGITFPAQSHVANLRVNLRYADGQTDRADLVPPFDLSDCWGKFFDDYGAGTEQFHKGVRYIPRKVIPSCGFENIGGRIGPAGSSQVDDPAQWVTVDTEAKLVPITLRRGVVLDSVEIEAMANDVIFGVMGATIV